MPYPILYHCLQRLLVERDTEHEFGKITGRYVIYRGEPFSENGVDYLNVEDYLRQL